MSTFPSRQTRITNALELRNIVSVPFHSSRHVPARSRRRGLAFWISLRGGFAAREDENSSFFRRAGGKESYDVSRRFKPFRPLLNGAFGISVCSVQGFRSHMEDEFLVAGEDFCGVFDGHGGDAVSRYTRQNLYPVLQASLAQTLRRHDEQQLEQEPITDTAAKRSANNFLSSTNSSQCSSDPQSLLAMAPTKLAMGSTATVSSSSQQLSQSVQCTPATIEDYEVALHRAFAKIDKEVVRIKHWSYQGSTAAIVWFHQEEPKNPDDNDAGEQHRPTIRHIITANIGDSRVVLSRQGAALDLSRDHKPNDPHESARILAVGGEVIWHGQTDKRTGRPIQGTGLYRVNGNLALSRAIGDSSERPAVTADPELSIVAIQPDDDFIVLATDGLWDVMSSEEVVHFVQAQLDAIEAASWDGATTASVDPREDIASRLVEESLVRGTFDNITVIIVWLKDHGVAAAATNIDNETAESRL